MSGPAVSVVVPVLDDPHRLARCLSALRASDFAEFEIVVVDDGSPTDASAAVARGAGARVVRLDETSGPAVARNRGAAAASGPIIFFVDADCLAHPDAIGRVAAALAPGSPYDAVFGSYGESPESPALVSRWKNLAHRHTHQSANPEAGTFWSGCGAIRRQIFLDFGGFDETYARPCIEDIELGMRLKASGRRIRLDRDLQVEHLKRWRLGKLVRTDVLDRGLPWTRVLLAAAKSGGPKVDDLNVGASQKVAALAAAALVGVFLIGGVWRPWLWAVPAVALGLTLLLDALTARGAGWKVLTPLTLMAYLGGGAWLAVCAPAALLTALPAAAAVLWINRGFYRLLARLGGVGFCVGGFVPHVVYYLCALTGYALGTASHLVRPRSGPAPNT